MLPALNGNKRAKIEEPLLPPLDESEFLPLQPDVGDLDEARMALTRAAHVIHSQEERIRQLENLALTDELTGLFNRRGFLLALERELSAARRDATARGVLVMVDLDGFKGINDTWGHGVGDEYLQIVAHTLLTHVRGNDIVARLGGDEFAVLFTRMNEETGLARLEKLEAEFNNRALHWGGHPIPLRGSFGLAAYKGYEKPETIMAAADLKLYARKARRGAVKSGFHRSR